MLKTLYRQVDGKRLVICGHLTRQEVAAYKSEGWRERKPNVNKHGIPVKG